MVIDEERNVENPEQCECQFAVGEDGQPTILCPDEKSQQRVVRSMQAGDVVVRVVPVMAEVDHEDGVGQDNDEVGDDLEEPVELEVGSIDLDDDDDDSDDDDGDEDGDEE